MTYELTELDTACLGYELDMGILDRYQPSFILVFNSEKGWHTYEVSLDNPKEIAHLIEQSAILAAWTLNKAAALNRCERGKQEGAEPFFYYPREHPKQGEITACVQGLRCSGNIIRPFASRGACDAAIASIGGEAVMVKVLDTLGRIF